ncbi:MAG: nucleoside triphosphate pyrophosphohydrolase [Rhodospirillaceae bacterium]|nr:nucleoside triphosphate pyrophosphohydrolase [Rhodospirillaceae bacterium]
MKDNDLGRGIDRLVEVMARLRHPQDGCPWDLEQTFATIAPYTIEEAYEVADAIERNDMPAVREEVGDLLLQVVYYAQMGRERGLFDFDAIANTIADKMIARHPHVFGDESVASAADMNRRWEAQKEAERMHKAGSQGGVAGTLDGIAPSLPAMTRALKLQRRAARVGFDWPSAVPVFEKIEEETAEARQALASGDDDSLREEVGDLLFSVVNLARKVDVDPEQALRAANRKFETRFRRMEDALAAQDRSPADADLDELDGLWNAAKIHGAKNP